MTKMKLTVSLGIACLMAVLGSTCAQANQYTIGESSQNVTLVGNGSGSANVMFGSCVVIGGNSVCELSGEAFTPGVTLMPYILEEIYTGSGSSPITAGPGNGGIFNVNMNGAAARISFDGGATWKVVNYTAFTNGAANPEPYGTWNDGPSAPFEFALEDIDMNGRCSLGTNCSLDLASLTSGAMISSPISSGEFDFTNDLTPEPAALSLFGIGLLGIAFLLRRQLKRVV